LSNNPEIHRLIKLLEGRERKVALFHGNGDPDALSSAFALSTIFPNITLSFAGGLNRAAKNLAAFLGFEITEFSSGKINGFDLAIVLDTSSPSQLELVPEIPKLVIDHHAENSAWHDAEGVVMYYTDPGKRSCAEVVYEIAKMAGRPLPEKAIAGLVAGILTDTGHLTFALPETLRTLAGMLDTIDLGLEEINNSMLFEGENISKRIAKLRAAQRVKIEEFQGIIMATSIVNAFEGDAARALVLMGADIVWVGSVRKLDYRISARATPSLIKMGVHLGRFLEEVGREVNAQGGGHPGAAGITGRGDVEAVLHICRGRFNDELRLLNGENERDSEEDSKSIKIK